MPSAFNDISALSNENDSSLIRRPNIITPFEKCLNKYEGSERDRSNATEEKNAAIINSDNENERAIHFTTSSSKAASNNLKYCSLNNVTLIDTLRQNKTSFNSFQSDSALFNWGQTLTF